MRRTRVARRDATSDRPRFHLIYNIGIFLTQLNSTRTCERSLIRQASLVRKHSRTSRIRFVGRANGVAMNHGHSSKRYHDGWADFIEIILQGTKQSRFSLSQCCLGHVLKWGSMCATAAELQRLLQPAC